MQDLHAENHNTVRRGAQVRWCASSWWKTPWSSNNTAGLCWLPPQPTVKVRWLRPLGVRTDVLSSAEVLGQSNGERKVFYTNVPGTVGYVAGKVTPDCCLTPVLPTMKIQFQKEKTWRSWKHKMSSCQSFTREGSSQDTVAGRGKTQSLGDPWVERMCHPSRWLVSRFQIINYPDTEVQTPGQWLRNVT